MSEYSPAETVGILDSLSSFPSEDELEGEKARVVGALKWFVSDLIFDKKRFDYIIPIERKGTALVRTALAGSNPDEWHRVISPEAVGRTLHGKKGARVLILDDSVWSGTTLGETVKLVKESGIETDITTAAFISHKQSPRDCLDVVYYRALTDESFRKRRRVLVDYLQQAGSLLLDTEHLEIEARPLCPADEFFEAFAGWGEVVRFAQSSDRVNCTVFQEVSRIADQLDRNVLPSYANLEDSVCKIRVISRPGRQNTFSILPIFFPTLLLGKEAVYEHPRMIWTKDVSRERLFQCVGLSVAIELLGHAMQHVTTALRGRVEFSYRASDLTYLYAVFPEVVTDQIVAELDRFIQSTQQRSARPSKNIDEPEFANLVELALKILFSAYDPLKSSSLKRLKMKDILQQGPLNGETEARASAALDILIDSACILPRVESRQEGPLERQMRVFVPDGEIMTRTVIREALLAGRGMELEPHSL